MPTAVEPTRRQDRRPARLEHHDRRIAERDLRDRRATHRPRSGATGPPGSASPPAPAACRPETRPRSRHGPRTAPTARSRRPAARCATPQFAAPGSTGVPQPPPPAPTAGPLRTPRETSHPASQSNTRPSPARHTAPGRRPSCAAAAPVVPALRASVLGPRLPPWPVVPRAMVTTADELTVRGTPSPRDAWPAASARTRENDVSLDVRVSRTVRDVADAAGGGARDRDRCSSALVDDQQIIRRDAD